MNVETPFDLSLKGAKRGSTLALVELGLVYPEIMKKEEGVTMEAVTFAGAS